MPELPEVETIVRRLRRQGICGRRIRNVHLEWPGVVDLPGRKQFLRTVPGRIIRSLRRRAKYLVFELDSGYRLLAHLRMSGRIYLESNGGRHAAARLTIELDDGRRLLFVDPRKFGRWSLVASPDPVLPHLGPEPLDRTFTAESLARRMQGLRRQIKPLLLDQSFLAGLGNIYADEALWMAGIHPCRRSEELNPGEIRALHHAIQAVLRQGIRNGGTSLGEGRPNFRDPGGRLGGNRRQLKVFHRTGQPCPRCGATIVRMVVGQRGTHVCPACQIRPSWLPSASR